MPPIKVIQNVVVHQESQKTLSFSYYPLRLKNVLRMFSTHLNIKVSNSQYHTFTYFASIYSKTLYGLWLESKFFLKIFLSIILIQRLIICTNNLYQVCPSQRFLSTGLDMDSFSQINWVFIYCMKCTQKRKWKRQQFKVKSLQKNSISKSKK